MANAKKCDVCEDKIIDEHYWKGFNNGIRTEKFRESKKEPCNTNNEVGMNFPETWEEYEQYYGFNDTEEVYSNNIQLIPSFRVKQWLDNLKIEPCDCISRQAVLEIAKSSKSNWIDNSVLFKRVNELPPVTPQLKIGHWIDGDDKCPCCGKSKFEGLDADIWADWQPKFCPNCGAKMESEDKKC